MYVTNLFGQENLVKHRDTSRPLGLALLELRLALVCASCCGFGPTWPSTPDLEVWELGCRKPLLASMQLLRATLTRDQALDVGDFADQPDLSSLPVLSHLHP